MTTLAEVTAAMYSRPVTHSPPDPLAGVRAELDRLAMLAPAAGVARGLLDVGGMPCAPSTATLSSSPPSRSAPSTTSPGTTAATRRTVWR